MGRVREGDFRLGKGTGKGLVIAEVISGAEAGRTNFVLAQSRSQGYALLLSSQPECPCNKDEP
jgi:hypothetical protein